LVRTVPTPWGELEVEVTREPFEFVWWLTVYMHNQVYKCPWYLRPRRISRQLLNAEFNVTPLYDEESGVMWGVNVRLNRTAIDVRVSPDGVGFPHHPVEWEKDAPNDKKRQGDLLFDTCLNLDYETTYSTIIHNHALDPEPSCWLSGKGSWLGADCEIAVYPTSVYRVTVRHPEHPTIVITAPSGSGRTEWGLVVKRAPGYDPIPGPGD